MDGVRTHEKASVLQSAAYLNSTFSSGHILIHLHLAEQDDFTTQACFDHGTLSVYTLLSCTVHRANA